MCVPLSAQRIIPDEKIIDYSCENQSLRDVLYELSEKTNVTIAWQEQIVPGDSIVTFSVRKERLGKIIDYLILDHDLKYRIVGNQISIIRDKFKVIEKEMITISGFLRDGESGEGLVNANIYLQDKSLGTITNEYGFYSFTIPKGSQRIYYSYLGYDNGIKEVTADKDQTFDVNLIPSNFMKEIIITETKLTPIPLNAPEVATVDVLAIDQIRSRLALAGEPDVMRMALSNPGVTSGADGFGGMSVRGGATNQNLILFDGIPIYNSDHAFGMFSIFNSRVIKSAKLYKGAFPSHYSGRLSSVMDIRTREGNFKKISGEVSLGLLTGSVALEGPIVKEKASFLFSARRTLVDPWLKSISKAYHDGKDQSGETQYYFYDVNGKINFNLGRHSKVYFSYYSGKDFFENQVRKSVDAEEFPSTDFDQINWDIGTSLGSLRFNSRLSQKMFLNATAYKSFNNYDAFDHDRLVRLKNASDSIVTFNAGYYQSRIEDTGLKLEFDFIPSAKQRLKFGAGIINHSFSPGLILSTEADSLNTQGSPVKSEDLANQIDDLDITGTEIEVFIEDNFKFGKYTNLNIGYNHMIVTSGIKTYHIPQPRVLFSTGSESNTIKLSAGRMGQFLHSLNNTGVGIPIDVWLPSTEKIAPETSWAFSIGDYFQKDPLGIIGLEFFYKKYEGLTRYGTDGLIDISEDSNWEELVPIGEGESYGTEFSYHKTKGKTKINLGYTLSWSNRTFEALNNGNPFRFRYDRRHVINVGLIHRFNPNIEVTANWEFGSGTPITVPDNNKFIEINEITGEPIIVLIYKELNNSILPDYHRLDIGINIHSEYTWGSSVLTIGLYNAYNQQNPFYRDTEVNIENRELIFEDVTLIPILPALSYTVKF